MGVHQVCVLTCRMKVDIQYRVSAFLLFGVGGGCWRCLLLWLQFENCYFAKSKSHTSTSSVTCLNYGKFG